jgi:hypothetical protein
VPATEKGFEEKEHKRRNWPEGGVTNEMKIEGSELNQ